MTGYFSFRNLYPSRVSTELVRRNRKSKLTAMSPFLLISVILILFTKTGNTEISCQDSGGCSNAGACVLGTCQCNEGTIGDHCEQNCIQRNSPSCDRNLAEAACRVLNNSNMQAVPQICMDLRREGQGIPGCISPTNRSCLEIKRCYPSVPSGNYQLNLGDGSTIETYCEMQPSSSSVANCGGEGGWTRIALVNMTAPDASCPLGLTQGNFSGRILCTHNTTGCQSTMFSTFNLNYCEACGRVAGYQFGTTEAFSRSIFFSTLTINDPYLDGVSITHGSGPRTHIWSYPAGVTTTRTDRFGCPCNSGSTAAAPSFVGNNYYCESAATSFVHGIFYPDDVLWDGQQCTGNEGTCCTNPDQPWFNTTLSQNANDDVELRLCFDQSVNTEGTPLELIELYIR